MFTPEPQSSKPQFCSTIRNHILWPLCTDAHMTEAVVIPLSASILPCSFPSIRMKVFDIPQFISLCTLAYTGFLYQHFPCPTPLIGASIEFIRAMYRNLPAVPLRFSLPSPCLLTAICHLLLAVATFLDMYHKRFSRK